MSHTLWFIQTVSFPLELIKMDRKVEEKRLHNVQLHKAIHTLSHPPNLHYTEINSLMQHIKKSLGGIEINVWGNVHICLYIFVFSLFWWGIFIIKLNCRPVLWKYFTDSWHCVLWKTACLFFLIYKNIAE